MGMLHAFQSKGPVVEKGDSHSEVGPDYDRCAKFACPSQEDCSGRWDGIPPSLDYSGEGVCVCVCVSVCVFVCVCARVHHAGWTCLAHSSACNARVAASSDNPVVMMDLKGYACSLDGTHIVNFDMWSVLASILSYHILSGVKKNRCGFLDCVMRCIV